MSAEMKQHADLKAARAEIADKLWAGRRWKPLGSFAFDEHSVVDDQVQALARNEPSFVVDRNRHFPVHLVPAKCELVREGARVRSLAHSTTAKVVEDDEECRHDRVHTLGLEKFATHATHWHGRSRQPASFEFH